MPLTNAAVVMGARQRALLRSAPPTGEARGIVVRVEGRDQHVECRAGDLLADRAAADRRDREGDRAADDGERAPRQSPTDWCS